MRDTGKTSSTQKGIYRQLASGTIASGLAEDLVRDTEDHGIECLVIPDPLKYEIADPKEYFEASKNPKIDEDLVYGIFLVMPGGTRVDVMMIRRPHLRTYQNFSGVAEFLQRLGFKSYNIPFLDPDNLVRHDYLISRETDGTYAFSNPNVGQS